MPEVERTTIIELLQRLGDESDEVVLRAGREAHRRITEAGLDWDMLLVPGPDAEPVRHEDEGEDDFPADEEHAVFEAAEAADETEAVAEPPDPGDQAEDARIIERLLARKDLSADLREELGDFRRDLADGALSAMDRRYIRALAARLGA